MNIASIIIVLAIALLVFLAARRLLSKGSCECPDCHVEGGCKGCSAADKMVADIEKAAR